MLCANKLFSLLNKNIERGSIVFFDTARFWTSYKQVMVVLLWFALM